MVIELIKNINLDWSCFWANEMWKPVDGYETEYSISTYGRVKALERITRNGKNSIMTNKEKIMRYSIQNTGYYTIILTINGNKKNILIHRLMCINFIPNPDNKKCVDHIDGNKLNNKLENLRWATPSENLMNKKKKGNTTSIYKGVYCDKRTNKWISRVNINGTSMWYGTHNTENEAGIAYNNKAIELFGTFAKINNII